jgi:hypothetical protein
LTSTAAQHLIAEPGAENVREYRKRVTTLAAEYFALFFGALFGIALLIWKAQLYVTLAQRSNVETLTLAFFLVFFGYLAILSVRGALGCARIAWFALQVRFGVDRVDVERRKMRALGPAGSGAAIDLNVLLEVDGRPCESFEIPVADRAGQMGRILVDGARVRHLPAHKDGSSDLLAFFQSQVVDVLGETADSQYQVEIVVWKAIDDQQAERYHSMVEFARNLDRHLDTAKKGGLWPTVRLSAAQCEELERRLAAVCEPLRDEGFLPEWDYAGEHKLPIIPEPLGLVSLSRTEQRVDSVSSMGCAVWVVLAAVAILALFVLFPPWVPGA